MLFQLIKLVFDYEKNRTYMLFGIVEFSDGIEQSQHQHQI